MVYKLTSDNLNTSLKGLIKKKLDLRLVWNIEYTNTFLSIKELFTFIPFLFSMPIDGVTFKCNHNNLEAKAK